MTTQMMNVSELKELLNGLLSIQEGLEGSELEVIDTEEEIIIKKPLKKRKLKELKGLGKELWKKVEVGEYLNSERDSWGK